MTDEQFEAAYRDPYNRRVMGAATRPFLGTLDEDERLEASLLGLRGALLKYDASRAGTFAAILHRRVSWRCTNMVRDKGRARRRLRPLEEAPPEKLRREDGGREGVVEWVDMLPDDDLAVLVQHYWLGMTVREIGRANGYSRGTARNRLEAAREGLLALV